ncbi:MAG: hypothetical protein D6733_07405 [Methanobacteriota archaeon]|nr:MAG: hypothetical protein D6733_07405 [Euryarchaeota archaeon]
MAIRKTPIWTWIIPGEPRAEDEAEWFERGGKWLVYGGLSEMEALAERIEGYVEAGEVVSAKYWNASETSAMCIYSLDRDRRQTLSIIRRMGFEPTAWEYDYGRCRNWRRPSFLLSALYKLRILLRTFGPIGALRFIFSAL